MITRTEKAFNKIQYISIHSLKKNKQQTRREQPQSAREYLQKAVANIRFNGETLNILSLRSETEIPEYNTGLEVPTEQ